MTDGVTADSGPDPSVFPPLPSILKPCRCRFRPSRPPCTEEGLDGWLLYDFHGSNPIARRLAGLDSGDQDHAALVLRRSRPAGEPKKLVHAIEPLNLDHVPGSKTIYSQRDTLAAGLKAVLGGLKRIAMEYSPGNNIPYISRVDAGTVEAVRQLGVDVASSGDLVQRFEAIWSDEALQTHRAASERALPDQGSRVRLRPRRRAAPGAR